MGLLQARRVARGALLGIWIQTGADSRPVWSPPMFFALPLGAIENPSDGPEADVPFGADEGCACGTCGLAAPAGVLIAKIVERIKSSRT